MVDVITKVYARNTGVQHDLIVGASILDYNWNEVYNYNWIVWYNAPAGMTDSTWMKVGISINLSPGTYRVIAKAWESYEGGTLVEHGDGYDWFKGGKLIGELDKMDTTFTVAEGMVTADITNLEVTI